MLEDSDLPHPPTPSLPKHWINLLKMLTLSNKQTALHILQVINHLSLTILAHYSPFAIPLCAGNPFPYMLNSSKLGQKYPQTAELLQKSSSLVRGLRKPLQEELVGPFSLPGILENEEFNEASPIIGDLQKPSSTEPPPFAKDSSKALDDIPKKSKKRGRDLLLIKSIASQAHEKK